MENQKEKLRTIEKRKRKAFFLFLCDTFFFFDLAIHGVSVLMSTCASLSLCMCVWVCAIVSVCLPVLSFILHFGSFFMRSLSYVVDFGFRDTL